MKNTLALAALILASGQFISVDARAQGTTTYLSSLNEFTAGSLPVASNAWIATWFRTGPAPLGYYLDSIQLLMNQPFGNPSGFTIMLWDFQAAQGIATLTGPEPSTAGVFTYNASSFSLAPSAVYWFVVTAQTTVSTGAFQWNYSSVNSVQQNGWLTGGYQTSSDGLVWSRENSGGTFQFAVNATVIPEPNSFALVVFGTFFYAARLLRKRRSKP